VAAASPFVVAQPVAATTTNAAIGADSARGEIRSVIVALVLVLVVLVIVVVVVLVVVSV
jgi:hypothetical protein